jgi:hypothetical protein
MSPPLYQLSYVTVYILSLLRPRRIGAWERQGLSTLQLLVL